MNNQAMVDTMIQEILKSINYMLNSSLDKTTKIYNGIIVSNNNDGRWNIQYNGETHPVKPYNISSPEVGTVVKVFIPQNNQALAFFM